VIVWLALRILEPVDMTLDSISDGSTLAKQIEQRPLLLGGARDLQQVRENLETTALSEEERDSWYVVADQIVAYAAYLRTRARFEGAWRPMLGKEGAINLILQGVGLINKPIEVLLFSELSVIIGMTQIYCVFMVGPIAFMMGRIDQSVIEAAQDLGAGFWRIFRTIILPLSMPGVVVGAIFVSVMVLGEFATSAALSGRKVNLLGNIIVTQVGSLKWAFAAVAGVILTILMGIVVAALLRVVDLRKEL